MPPVAAQFEAMASTRLPDGSLLPLGPVTAEWFAAPFDGEAKRTQDSLFAGHFDVQGRFLPNAGGPNPAREFSADNSGQFDRARQHQGRRDEIVARGHLVVTVQR